jgi:hypothetical protein
VIALWRGYIAGRFYAHFADHDGAFSLSPSFQTWAFPWQQRLPITEDPAALEALETLEADLLEQGWEKMRRAPGSEWYELRFRRPRRRHAVSRPETAEPAPHLRAVRA